MARSWMTRLGAMLLLATYVGTQPALLCAADCLLGRHAQHEVMHHGHHGAAMPCHGGQVSATQPLVAAQPAAPAGPVPSLLVALLSGEHSTVPPLAGHRLASASLSLDTPPPRG